MLRTTEAIRAILQRFHKKEDYYVRAPLELLVQARETSRIFSIVLGSIAGISLVVGGIGIMNIMLATVTERTREIGIRRALGARRRDITLQFLVETLVLSTLGGALGVALGLAVPWLVTLIQEMQTQIEPWTLRALLRDLGRGRRPLRHLSRRARVLPRSDRGAPARVEPPARSAGVSAGPPASARRPRSGASPIRDPAQGLKMRIQPFESRTLPATASTTAACA